MGQASEPEIIGYSAEWLPPLAALARAHARLVLPGFVLDDATIEWGLQEHAFWPFYNQGLESAQILLAIQGTELLAAAQVGAAGYGWGYGAAPGDGPDWLYDVHLTIFWLFAWPGWPAAQAAAAALAARIVGQARSAGLPGLEAFRGGPGFLPFGTQLSSRWPHLLPPLRAAGFRQPRYLLVYCGQTTPDALPDLEPLPAELTFRGRGGRLEAWLGGAPAGVCVATPLRAETMRAWPRRSPRTRRDDGGEPPGAPAPLAGVRASSRSGQDDAGEPETAETPGDEQGEPLDQDPRTQRWAAIRRLNVDPDLRGQGIGSALFAAQLRRLHAQGVTRYLLHVPDDPDDAAAHRLYAKFGTMIDRQQVLRVSF